MSTNLPADLLYGGLWETENDRMVSVFKVLQSQLQQWHRCWDAQPESIAVHNKLGYKEGILWREIM